VRISRPATSKGVPRVSYPLRPGHDKTDLVRLFPEAGQPSLLAAVASKTVEVQYQGDGNKPRVTRRHMEQECAVPAADRNAHRCFSGNQAAWPNGRRRP